MELIWLVGPVTVLKTINEILTAGISITAFSLFLFSLSFNLKERVVRTFIFIMMIVVIVFSAEDFAITALQSWQAESWLRLQWVGITLLPAVYLDFSDALLAVTGKPSRWRRRWAVRLTYLISLFFLISLPAGWLVGSIVMDQPPAPHLAPTFFTNIFAVFYLIVMVFTFVNFIRSYRRTVTPTSRRRMAYLLFGAMAPALGSFPFLLFGSGFSAQYPIGFWIIAIITNSFVGFLIVVMAYAVAFFGVPWSDRVVKSRLFRWLLRGPATASLTLAVTTIIRRTGELLGETYTALVPITMVSTVVICQYLITVFAPFLDKWLFYGNDKRSIELIRAIEDRMLTRADLSQFIEMVLSALVDHLQAQGAYLVAANGEGLDLVGKIGKVQIRDLSLDGTLSEIIRKDGELPEIYQDGTDWLVPIRGNEEQLLGLAVIVGLKEYNAEPEVLSFLRLLCARAALALQDRLTQEQIFRSLEDLTPQVSLIQRLRAAGRYSREGVLLGNITLDIEETSQLLRDALTRLLGWSSIDRKCATATKNCSRHIDGFRGKSSQRAQNCSKKCCGKIAS